MKCFALFVLIAAFTAMALDQIDFGPHWRTNWVWVVMYSSAIAGLVAWGFVKIVGKAEKK